MSVVEKALVGVSMAAIGGLGGYYLFKTASLTSDKNEVYQQRLKIIEKENIKVLYSTMSFMYLQGFNRKDLDSFFTLYDILQLSKPNLVAIPLSKKEAQDKYMKIVDGPKFEETMKRAEYFAKIKSDDLKTVPGLDVEDLDKLYPLYFCKKNKCSIIYAEKQQEDYDKLLQAKLKLKEIYSEQPNLNLGMMEATTKEDATKSKELLERETYFDKKEEDYVDAIMQEINPKFSILPTGLYKTIVAVSEPQHIKGIAQRWKTKFKTAYNHEVIEDEESEKKEVKF